MDYETVIPEQPCGIKRGCEVEIDCNLIWSYGEIIEVRLPITGGFLVGENFISIGDFISNSNTKAIKMVLIDHLGEEVNTQISYSGDLEYLEEGHIACYYEVDKELSEELRPGSYQLYVYLINSIDDKAVLNTLLTGPEGLNVTIF